MTAVLEGALALGGIFAMLAMGGTWSLVFLLALVAGTAMFLFRRRRILARQPREPGPSPTGSKSISSMWRRIRRTHRVRTARQQQRHDLWVVAKSLLAIFVLWNGISFVRYVGHDNGDTLSERIATWGRDNHLGGVIDVLEAHLYSTPPSKRPAGKLALAGAVTLPGTPATLPGSASPGGQPSQARPAQAAGVPTGAAGAHAPTNSVSVPTSPPPTPPTPLNTFFAPALEGEGQWTAIARAAGQDAMWATSIRPLPAFGGVVASMAVIDQTHLRAGLFNGAEEPGGSWKRANRVPVELQPALIAAMNGGFRF